MKAMGLSEDDAERTLEAVAALLHLGNVTYEGKGNEPANSARVAWRWPSALVRCALSVDHAALGRDALPKAVHSALFGTRILFRCTRAWLGSLRREMDSLFIGLLDALGHGCARQLRT